MVHISFAITVHNEGSFYLEPLFQKITKYLEPGDEIVVLDDMSDDSGTLETLKKYSDKISLHKRKFQGDFAEHKNYLKSLCKKEYIFFIDADENMHDNLMLTIREILFNNPQVDMYAVPRVNIVTGITEAHIAAWGWNLNSKKYVNFPDYQTRIIKNIPEIVWQGKVHERLVGHSTHAMLPCFDESQGPVEDYCLLHIKNIDRQEKQNQLYDKLQ